MFYQSGFLREQEEKRRYREQYGGRGKYKREPNQYFYDVYRGNQKVETGIAFGRKDLAEQRAAVRSRQRGGYRIKVYNQTKQRWVK